MKTPSFDSALHTGILSPSLRDRLAGFDHYGESRPVREAGSDFFDFLAVERQALVCSIGKASGSGIGASFTTASLQAFLRGLTRHHRGGLAAIVRDLNRTIYEIGPDGFYASLFYAWFDPLRSRLHYVNAGHEPVLLLSQRTGRLRRLENTGTVLGLSLRVGYRQQSVDLEAGDLLLAMTDGVTEALREEEIVHLLGEHGRERPVELVNRLLDAAASVTECTALAVRFKGPAASPVLEDAVELACTAA
jgi:sigma-B regulation protein RsbU (phosphoserine phosphatase)